eukprot:2610719-Alexandrium_andersonii.AAC.2
MRAIIFHPWLAELGVPVDDALEEISTHAGSDVANLFTAVGQRLPPQHRWAFAIDHHGADVPRRGAVRDVLGRTATVVLETSLSEAPLGEGGPASSSLSQAA